MIAQSKLNLIRTLEVLKDFAYSSDAVLRDARLAESVNEAEEVLARLKGVSVESVRCSAVSVKEESYE
jgi:hypothetical protein